MLTVGLNEHGSITSGETASGVSLGSNFGNYVREISGHSRFGNNESLMEGDWPCSTQEMVTLWGKCQESRSRI